MGDQGGEIIVGLDIGTTKVLVVVSETTQEGVDIIGVGDCQSVGIKRGDIINIEQTVSTIRKAIELAEKASGCEIRSVHVGISGKHIQSFNSDGIVGVKNRQEGVTKEDVERVIEAARAVKIPMDREVIHVIPKEFYVDDIGGGIKDPIGMSGVRLEAKVHIVTGSATNLQNLRKCINKAGLEIDGIVLSSLASAEACLLEDEKELGVALVDIGGGTTDIIVFVDSSVAYTDVITIGGQHLDNDISVGLRTPLREAQRLKLAHGCALIDKVLPEEEIEIPGIGGREPRVVPRAHLVEIIQPRMEEIFELVRKSLVDSGVFDMICSGVVLCGGTSLMEGVIELGEKILGMPVRIGKPIEIGGFLDMVNTPSHAVAVGLVKYASRIIKEGRENKKSGHYKKRGTRNSVFLERVKRWFSEAF